MINVHGTGIYFKCYQRRKSNTNQLKKPLIYNKGGLEGRERKSWPAYIAWKKNQFLILKDVFVFEIILKDD